MKTEIIAHRGSSYEAPENTVASVRLAWKHDADAAEIDVWMTADGHIIALHDETTTRTTGVELNVKAATWASLQTLCAGSWKHEKYRGEPIPHLSDILAIIPHGKRLFIEIKADPLVVTGLGPLFQKAHVPLSQIVILGYDYPTIRDAKKLYPEATVLLLFEFLPHETMRDWHQVIDGVVSRAVEAGLDGLDLDQEGLDQYCIQKALDAGLKVYVWTIDEPERALEMISYGVSGITTNRPLYLRQQLSKHESSTPLPPGDFKPQGTI